MAVADAASKMLRDFVISELRDFIRRAVLDPQTWARAKELLDGLTRAIAARSRTGRIRALAGVVRQHAQSALDNRAQGRSVVEPEQAADWIRRADQIEAALSILELEPRTARKAHLARLEQQTAALVEETLDLFIDTAPETVAPPRSAAPKPVGRLHMPPQVRRKPKSLPAETPGETPAS